jgi:TPM domain/Predicted membrane protein (DUF2207) C-terminal domain
MRRWSALLALIALALAASAAAAAGPPFPDPIAGTAVYDEANALRPATLSALEAEVDAIEARSGAEVAIYLQVDPDATEQSNLDAARALMDQWGVGRSGFDDGLVFLVGLQPDLVHGKVSLFAGSGFKGAYLGADQLANIIADDFVPAARAGDLNGAMLATLAAIDRGVTPGGQGRLTIGRVLNAILGLALAPLALLGSLTIAFIAWRREGRDPYFSDSPSVLMAGAPAGLTPALATVVRNGRSDQRAVTTALMELAAGGWIAFENVDLPVRGDEGGPTIEILPPQPAVPDPIGPAEQYLFDALRAMGGTTGSLDRKRLVRLHASIGAFHGLIEADAVSRGWFHEQPRKAIGRWMAVAVGELLVGGGVAFAGVNLPMAGALALGVALAVGGLGTLGFASQMSQRTPNGAMVDGMLKAYRRTLEKTLALARTMEQVAADETVRILAGTPDKAVVWGIALGLHEQVARVLERSMQDEAKAAGASAGGYRPWYPLWLGTSSSPAGGLTVSRGGGGLFSGSAVPDVSGMFATLGSIGSTPSSSGGGGFGGGSSGGGGGASGSF